MSMLDGQTTTVMGGHSGIGEAISRTFAAQASHVVIDGRPLDEVTRVADEFGRGRRSKRSPK